MKSLINNNNLKITTKKFSVIIGITPSKGARSPLLWNEAYKKHNLKVKMYPLDINTNKFFKLLKYLKDDKNFIGGSITVPYKEMALKNQFIQPDKEAKKIGSINSFYKNSSGKLSAFNSDGEAAIECLKNNKINIKNKKILMLGCGGAGKAIATYLSKSIIDKKNLSICVRNIKKYKKYTNSIGAQIVDWNYKDTVLNKFDLIINTTSLGFKHKIKSPLSGKLINSLSLKTIIFDIIYDPIETYLIKSAKKRGLKTINGIEMNFLQAVIAFNKINKIKKDDKSKTNRYMSKML